MRNPRTDQRLQSTRRRHDFPIRFHQYQCTRRTSTGRTSIHISSTSSETTLRSIHTDFRWTDQSVSIDRILTMRTTARSKSELYLPTTGEMTSRFYIKFRWTDQSVSIHRLTRSPSHRANPRAGNPNSTNPRVKAQTKDLCHQRTSTHIPTMNAGFTNHTAIEPTILLLPST